GRLGDRRLIAVPKHGGHNIGDLADDRAARHVRPAKKLDRRAHRGLEGKVHWLRRCRSQRSRRAYLCRRFRFGGLGRLRFLAGPFAVARIGIFRLGFLAQRFESEKIEDVVQPRIASDAVLDAEADKIRFAQRFIDIEGHENHVLTAVKHQSQPVLGLPLHKVDTHDSPPYPELTTPPCDRDQSQANRRVVLYTRGSVIWFTDHSENLHPRAVTAVVDTKGTRYGRQGRSRSQPQIPGRSWANQSVR